MLKYKKSIITLLLTIILLISNVAVAEVNIMLAPKVEPEVNLEFFNEVLELIKRDYPFRTSEEKLIEGALKGMLKSLDPYSDYYTSEEVKGLMSTITGNFSGVGIYIEEKDGYINVIDTIEGQAAVEAGMKKDDLIVSVDGVDIKDMGLEKASSLIKGAEGSEVSLKIKRGQEELTFKLTRKTVKINPVKYQVFEKNIGYILLESFNSQTSSETKKALDYFDSQGIKKVILDLRNNSGGLLDEAIGVSRLFVSEGPIVHIKEKNKPLTTHISRLEKEKYRLMVLVNENSASSSEIVAGAIKDRRAGILIGTRTFGKGIVQSLINVTGGRMIKLTTSEYLTPNKISIHGKGINPHLTIRNTEPDIDKQLEKAINILR